ncbi:MAG: hypothetical protein C0415_00145 [Thermodesulfovibrio sp.]|nr:hypothetical protein [Thermodesulfovibrio sp.]
MNRRLIEKADALLAKEKGTVFKEPGGKVNICLVYPNTYHVGMSNLGFQGIYGFLNKRDDIVCERAFLPYDEDIDEHIRTETPIFSFESKRPLQSFDIVAFSISFENDYPNIIKILDISKIPLQSSERNEYHPLLIAGGVCAFSNPEPIAPVFDILFIGEAEESLNEFFKTYGEGHDKNEIKRQALQIEGIYIPEFYRIIYNSDGTISERISLYNAPEKIKRTYLKDLSSSAIKTAIVTSETEFSDMYLIEAMRGCPWTCRFCLVRHIYSPQRQKRPENIKAEIDSAKQLTPKIGIIGPSLTDYPYIKDILCIEGVDFSITSLRASPVSAELVELMQGSKSVSIAPEAGTERLRKVIDKRITEEDILTTSRLVFNAGIENLRLYFMIGLPSERNEDIIGIVKLVRKIRSLSIRGNIILSISTFVPKPFTPFQWHQMEKLDTLKEKLKFIKIELRNVKGVKVFHDVPKYAHMQGLFSTGDRKIFDVLLKMVRTDDFKTACSEANVDMDFYVFREKGFNEILPWDFIDTGISKDRLWKEYSKALKE